ncbi:hypothetical protein J6590_015957 [Homalodisca vitripennis]|nr:hypothetical protein J6590_015957 [Homalodisca vitripennis]
MSKWFLFLRLKRKRCRREGWILGTLITSQIVQRGYIGKAPSRNSGEKRKTSLEIQAQITLPLVKTAGRKRRLSELEVRCRPADRQGKSKRSFDTYLRGRLQGLDHYTRPCDCLWFLLSCLLS